MSAIKRMAQDLWYSTPGKDRVRARKISAELGRFERIEEKSQAAIEYWKKTKKRDFVFQVDEFDKLMEELKKVLKPLEPQS